MGLKITKRKQEGKDSVIFRKNEVIPKARIQKQIQRNSFATALERYAEGFPFFGPS